ncbi:MAG TPA: hypothetical protein VF789_31115 [Thermoanaerobaculia bacterium]
MNQEVPPGDMLFGGMVLAIFLVFVFLLGLLISRFKNARFAKAWKPLAPLIDGKVVEDGGGAATSWLTGSYRGRRVVASMVPDRNRYSEDSSGHRYNYFDVALLDMPGQQDWKIEHQTAILGFGQTGWRIVTKDKALEERLNASGILFAVSPFGSPEIAYSARDGKLQYSEDVTPQWIPTPERFQQELELLLTLAKVNEEVNPA